jgi:hypothetical protein
VCEAPSEGVWAGSAELAHTQRGVPEGDCPVRDKGGGEMGIAQVWVKGCVRWGVSRCGKMWLCDGEGYWQG